MNYKYITSSSFSIAGLGLALLLVVTITIVGCESDSGLIEHQSFTFQSDTMNSKPVVIIRDVRFSAEIAMTDIEKAKGLSGRESLPQKTGMLFVFQHYPAPAFWMKAMEFNLDLVWIDLNCKIVSTTLNVPYPKSLSGKDLPTYASSKPAHYVFEINAGEATKYEIEVGDPVEFSGTQIDGAGC